MRIRIDGDDYEVAREARLALRLAGFVLTSHPHDADYVVSFLETNDPDDRIVLAGTDGPFERELINRLAVSYPVLVLDRRGARHDQRIALTIPPIDDLRRLLSRILVELFLGYINRVPLQPATLAPAVVPVPVAPAVQPAIAPLPPEPVPAPSPSARVAAIAELLDQIVEELIQADPTRTELTTRVRRAVSDRRPWWWLRG